MSETGDAAGRAVRPLATQPRQTEMPPSGAGASIEEILLVEALRHRDERAFTALVDRYHRSLLRLATIYVTHRDVAEEVVQDTWVGVLQGLSRFEGRSSLKTWIFRILINRAKTRAEREGRSIPFCAFWDPEGDPGEPSVEPERFLGPDHPEWPGHWASPPQNWGPNPEERLLSQEAQDCLRKAIEGLPPTQREVITLRDIEEWSSEEVCNVLGIGETNQRVLLHRARARVRRALEQLLGKG